PFGSDLARPRPVAQPLASASFIMDSLLFSPMVRPGSTSTTTRSSKQGQSVAYCAAEAQNPAQAPLCPLGNAFAQGESVLASGEVSGHTSIGMSPAGGVAVMTMRSRSPAVDWRCKSPVRQQPHMVACTMPGTPTGKHRYVQVAQSHGSFRMAQ
ncbi:unnamed protein product, partial [Prorocentrum cordatum]